jgi:hypothetical protein
MLLKMTWRGEELKIFNTVEPASYRTRVSFFLVASRRVECTRALGEWEKGKAEREE